MTTYAAVPTGQAPAGSTLRLLTDDALVPVSVRPNADGTGTAQATFVQGALVYAPTGFYQLEYSYASGTGRQLFPVDLRDPADLLREPATKADVQGGAAGSLVAAHADLSGVTPDQHHAQRHALDGADHLIAGAVPKRDVVRAIAADDVDLGPAPVPGADYVLIAGSTATLASLPGTGTTPLTEANAITGGAAFETPVDLRYLWQARFYIYVATGVAGGFCKPQFWDGTGWVDLAAVAGELTVPLTAGAQASAGIKTVAAAARAVADGIGMLRMAIWGNTTSGAVTPQLRQAHLIGRAG